jgi:hypothetical protein
MDLLTPALITVSSLFTAYYYGSKLFDRLLMRLGSAESSMDDEEEMLPRKRVYDSPVQTPIIDEQANV